MPSIMGYCRKPGQTGLRYAGAMHPFSELADLPRPILLNVGRVAPEKNLEAFLSLDVPGSKVVVGDGPAIEMAD